MFVDKNGDYESNSLLVVVIVVSVIAAILFIAGVILLILHIKLRAAYKRSHRLCFYVVILIMNVYFTGFGEISSRHYLLLCWHVIFDIL